MADTLNLTAMAEHLKVTRDTLRRWVRKWPDFPVVGHGTNGQSYTFEADEVVAFVRQKRRDGSIVASTQSDRPTQPQAGLDLEEGIFEPGSLSLKEQIDTEKLELVRHQVARLQRQEDVARRALVPAADVVHALSALFAQWGKAQRASVLVSAKEMNLPEAVSRVFERNLAKAQVEFARSMPDYLKTVRLPSEGSEGA